MSIVGLPSRLIAGPEYRFGLEDNLTDAQVVDDLITVEMRDARGRSFANERTQQRGDELFFIYLELNDASRTATVAATYVEEQLEGSRCTRRVEHGVTRVRRIYFPPRCYEGAYRPTAVIVACGDGGIRLSGIQWRNWNGSVATGRAAMTANTCLPSCADGQYARYRVSLRAYAPRRCSDTERYQYTRLRIRFVGEKWPAGPRQFVQPFNCQ